MTVVEIDTNTTASSGPPVRIPVLDTGIEVGWWAGHRRSTSGVPAHRLSRRAASRPASRQAVALLHAVDELTGPARRAGRGQQAALTGLRAGRPAGRRGAGGVPRGLPGPCDARPTALGHRRGGRGYTDLDWPGHACRPGGLPGDVRPARPRHGQPWHRRPVAVERDDLLADRRAGPWPCPDRRPRHGDLARHELLAGRAARGDAQPSAGHGRSRGRPAPAWTASAWSRRSSRSGG